MRSRKNELGCLTFLAIWVLVALITGFFLQSVNVSGQSIGATIFVSSLLGFMIAFCVFAITTAINLLKVKDRTNQSTVNMQEINLEQEILDRAVVRNMPSSEPIFLNEDEEKFFKQFIIQLEKNELCPFSIRFALLSNGAFNIEYGTYPIGKIKLRGRKSYMQILKGLYKVEELEDWSVDEYIDSIPLMIRYIKYCRQG